MSVDNAGVKVGNRHRWGANGCLSVNLRVVTSDDLGVVATIELTRHGEARETANFGDARTLKQVERVTTSTDENELSQNSLWCSSHILANGDGPQSVLTTLNRLHRVVDVHFGFRTSDGVNQNVGQRTEVDVRAVHKPCRRNRFVFWSTGHDEWRPFVNDPRVVGELCAGEQRAVFQGFVSCLEIRNISCTPHERNMRNGNEESGGVGDRAVLDEGRPVLA